VAKATADGAVELAAVTSEMAEVAAEAAAEVRVVEAVRGEGHPVGRRGGV